ncbi:MAG: choice-of-anchor E domain-containing protein [Verrucomicrobiaceae bacterium]|nr:choice-of-anchor E domain-containing protein [Verrucomicrobiaceae bacterium]
MTTFTKIRFAIAILVMITAGNRAQANTITAGSGSFGTNWTNAGGSSFSQNMNYNLFNSSLGTLNSVTFCLTVKGYGDWMADYGGDGKGDQILDITLTGGQSFNVDGGNGWLGAGWVPVINNYDVSSTVFLNDVATPFWIMSPQNGPSFSWSDQSAFNLPNISEFIGIGTDSATFSSNALISYFTNPSVTMALEGHNFNWSANWQLKYDYTPVPEPGSALLLGSSCALLLRRRRGAKANVV